MKSRIVILLLVMSCCSLMAQDYTIYYSQIIKSPEYFNPSYSAHKDIVSAKLMLNSKYNSYRDNPKSCAFSLSIPLSKASFGSGINILKEEMGLRQIISVNGILNSCIKLSSLSFLSAGIQLGVRRLEYLRDRMITYGDVDMSRIELSSTKTAFGFGFFYNDLYNFIGIASSDIVINNIKLLENIDVYLGRNIPFSGSFVLRPSFLYKRFYGDELYHFRSELYYKNFVGGGIHYTLDRDYGFSIDVRLTPKIWMGYLYESGSKYSKMKLVSHSISLAYNVGLLNTLFDKIGKFRNTGLLARD